VTFGLSATSPESQKARHISVMKKILADRSRILSHDVCVFEVDDGACAREEVRDDEGKISG
jgi:hypothetical protein